MDSYKPLLTTLFSTGGGAAAWAMIDGILGTLLALVGLIGGVLGILWGWRSHRATMQKQKLERERLTLEQERLTLEIERLRGESLSDSNRGGDEAS